MKFSRGKKELPFPQEADGSLEKCIAHKEPVLMMRFWYHLSNERES